MGGSYDYGDFWVSGWFLGFLVPGGAVAGTDFSCVEWVCVLDWWWLLLLCFVM